MKYLICNYNRVSAEVVSLKGNKLMNIIWELHNTIMLLTRPIENVQKLA